ncbi:MAG: glycoside hydrolase family 38 C-terminal domain-containing protein [Candidatus Acidiferrales bacterium]
MRTRFGTICVALGILFFVNARASAQNPLPQPPADNPVLDLLRGIAQVPDGQWRFHTADLAEGQDPALDDSSWQQVGAGFSWSSGAAWFRREIDVPAAGAGYDFTGATLTFSFSTDTTRSYPNIIYVNGVRAAMGTDLEPIPIGSDVRPGQKIVIAVKVLCMPVANHFRSATISVRAAADRPDPGTVADALEADHELLGFFSDATQPTKTEAAAIIESANADVDASALTKGDQKTFDASLTSAIARLGALDPVLKQYSVRAVGNSHIDLAWLWPSSEAMEVVRNTFSTALQLMQEYPNYIYTQSSAQMDAWLQEKYPDLFAEIQKRVAEGRWEIVGGMWDEPDLNMPTGESQVRQLLIGKRYFHDTFGKDVRVGWNPDSFGYNWQLPQIYKKAGVDYFVTQKISWNDTWKFPYNLFWWEAPDGSRVLTYFPHSYVNTMSPVKIAGDFADLESKTPGLNEMMHLYGIGDHGGGPTRAMLEEGQRWMEATKPFPRVFDGTALGFFQDMEREAPSLNLPTWKNELYLEFHRGVYTTQAETKRHNRESEELLLNAEKFASLASLAGAPYPAQQLNDAWKKVLFNQFHDVAAGSGIPAIYKDADRDYADVRHVTEESLRDSIGTLGAYADTSGPGVAVLVVNPLAWDRNDVAEVNVQMPHATPGVEVLDAAGRLVLSEIVERHPETNTFRVRFLARGIPSLGYEVFRVVAAAKPRIAPSTLRASEGVLENEFLRVRVDAKTGCITSLVLKSSNYEALVPGTCGNLLQTFVDKPQEYDAWNIDADFEKVHWDLTTAESVQLVERGPLRAVIRVTKKFQNSTFVQDITVYAGIPRVDVVTDADWHEQHILLKAGFTLAAHSDVATYEIPFGTIERPTTRRTPQEQSMFEVPALQWADLGDATHGFSLLNDCKYGYDGKDNVLRISLLRSPTYPDPQADQGRHHFTYSLYPHDQDWRKADTVRQGYDLNYKLIVSQVASHDGALGKQHSFLRVAPENVVLTALKKDEDDDALIARFYEWAGRDTDVTLDLPAGARQAFRANLIEKPGDPLPLEGNRVTIHTGPYSIETVKIVFSPDSPARYAAAPSAAAKPAP